MSNQNCWLLAGAAWMIIAVGSAAAQDFPDENRKQLVDAMGGGRFLIFRDNVMKELKVSDDQKEKLFMHFAQQVMESGPFFDSLQGEKPAEREKKVAEHRQKAQEKLTAFLKETLKPDQIKRLKQVWLQQEGLLALGQDEVRAELKMNEEQTMKFVAIVQELQQKVQPLIKEAQSGGNPQEIAPKIMRLRKEHEQKIEGILSDAQKKQWKEMIGEPFDLGD